MAVTALDRRLAGRVVVAAACLVLLFSVRWDASLQHFDFQVWKAAANIVERGQDPYDVATLNLELHERPEVYGDHWREDRWQTDWRMHLFNPPVWLTLLRLLGQSALVVSAVGALLAYGAVVTLSRTAPTLDALGYIAATTWIFLFPQTATTFRLGQTGLLVCGLVGVALVLAGRSFAGVPAAVLAFKPHVAAAAILPDLVRGSGRRLAQLVAPTLLLVAITAVVYPISLWPSWIASVFSADRPAASVDMSLRTLSPRFALPESTSTFTLVAGVATTAWLSRRWRAADPRLLTLMTLAVVTYSSGHAFGHDWLWIVFIPILCRWSLAPTMFGAIGSAALYTVGNDLARGDDALINLTSVLALAATATLVAATCRSAGDDRRARWRSTPHGQRHVLSHGASMTPSS